VNYQQDDWTNWLATAEFQYNNRKNSIRVQLWKTLLERGSYGSNGHSMSRRFPHYVTKKLRTSNQSNGRSVKEYEEAV